MSSPALLLSGQGSRLPGFLAESRSPFLGQDPPPLMLFLPPRGPMETQSRHGEAIALTVCPCSSVFAAPAGSSFFMVS